MERQKLVFVRGFPCSSSVRDYLMTLCSGAHLTQYVNFAGWSLLSINFLSQLERFCYLRRVPRDDSLPRGCY
jgi:hypothetical protein